MRHTWACIAAALLLESCSAVSPERLALPETAPELECAPAWRSVTPHAAFEARDTAEPLVFEDRMWISNGYLGSPTKLYKDLWTSTDGSTWTLVTGATPYPDYSLMTVFKGRMWAVRESVWNSTDGSHWTRVSAKTPFGRRGDGRLVIFKDRMWRVSGGDDVWSTADGRHWTREVAHAAYGVRTAAAVAAFKGKLWLIGGFVRQPSQPPGHRYPDLTTANDVWSSADGRTWTQSVAEAPWRGRAWFSAATLAGRMWIVAGFNNTLDRNLDTTWLTADGEHWQRLPASVTFPPRHQPAVLAFKGGLWVIAGNSWPLTNDVWQLPVADVVRSGADGSDPASSTFLPCEARD